MPDPMERFASRLTATVLASARAANEDAWAVGTVERIDTGAGANQADLVTVTWRDGEYQVAHLEHYAPAVGHVVLMARAHNQLVIVGRIIGGPSRA